MANIVRFDCFEVDLLAGQIYKRGSRVNLRDKSFQILATLLEHPGEVVSRGDLRQHLWSPDVFVDFENNVNAAVARLRDALGDSAEHPRFIETLPRHGYRFVAAVSAVEDMASRAPAAKPRLLVLPFVNLTGDPAQEYFSDAMTDELITALACRASDRLAVIARGTSMHYKKSHKDIQGIGRALNVDYFVEGGVLRAGKQITINIQLIQAGDLTHLFAKKFDGRLLDLLGMQRRITDAIAAHLPAFAGRSQFQARTSLRDPATGAQDLAAHPFQSELPANPPAG